MNNCDWIIASESRTPQKFDFSLKLWLTNIYTFIFFFFSNEDSDNDFSFVVWKNKKKIYVKTKFFKQRTDKNEMSLLPFVVLCRRSTFNNNRLRSRSISNWITVAYFMLFQPDVWYHWIHIWISGTRYSSDSRNRRQPFARSNVYATDELCGFFFFLFTLTTVTITELTVQFTFSVYIRTTHQM